MTNGHETGSDFLELARRLRMLPRRASALLERVRNSRKQVLELTQRSFLTEAAKQSYRALFEDRLKALAQ